MRPIVYGLELDPETRCAHYHSHLDVIAIKMRCCGSYYACRECHDALADHACQTWPRSRWNDPGVLCGVCSAEMTITQYMGSGDRCPTCAAPFNPGCRTHYQLYFEPC